MRRLRALVVRFAGMFGADRREREIGDELESHVQMHVDEGVRAGMTPEEARRDAILRLGGLEKVRQAYRERGTIPFFETLGQDLRFAMRQLRKSTGFAVTAVLTLALGFSASVAIFAFVDAALLKPLPYQNPATLMDVAIKTADYPRAAMSYLTYADFKRMNHSFRSLDVYTGIGYLLTTASGAEQVPGESVTDGFFRTLGIAPVLGRDFHSGEGLAKESHSVILSYGAWQRRYGGRSDVIGQVVSLSGTPYTIVGVMPASFEFAPRNDAEFWTPFYAESTGCDARRSCHYLLGVGRLKDGVTQMEARADMSTIAARLEAQYPSSNRGEGAAVVPLAEVIVGDARPILLILLGGAGLLLMIACVNVSSLLLVRSESRKREIAVRGALGASPARLNRQFVTEGVVLVLVSAMLGLAGAYGASRVMLGLISKEMMTRMPYLNGVGLNLRVLGFAALVAVFATVIFSLTPILRLSLSEVRGSEIQGGLSGAGRASSVLWRRLGANLVIVELAIAVVLLVGAGLLGKSLYRLLHVDLKFEPDHLATMQIALPEAVYSKPEQIVAGRRAIAARLAALPGVVSVGSTSMLPVSENVNVDWIRFVGRPYDGKHIEVNEREISANYFSTLNAGLLRGRQFKEGEDSTKPLVAIVNQALAKRYFPGQDPIGQRVGDPSLSPGSLKQIVGVVDDVHESSLDAAIGPTIYVPFEQEPGTYAEMVVRTSQPAEAMLPTLVSSVRQVDRRIGVSDESTMMLSIHESPTAYFHRSSAWLVGGFAVLALLMGSVGLYGVIAYSVSQRTREIGVRMALGAQRISVLQLILKEGSRLTVWGIGTGVVCSLGAGALLRSMLFGVKPWDLATLAGVAFVLALVSMLASYLPARRAASVNPVEALRAE
jgi:macrolide transport system ATP-binding/permease protein